MGKAKVRVGKKLFDKMYDKIPPDEKRYSPWDQLNERFLSERNDRKSKHRGRVLEGLKRKRKDTSGWFSEYDTDEEI